jgi:hypothetical protein
MLAVILEVTAGNASRKGDLCTAAFGSQTEFNLWEVSGILAMTYRGVEFEWSTNGAHNC